MGNFLINVLGVFLLIMLGVFLFYKLNPGYFDRQIARRAQKVREAQVKSDADLLGRRMVVPRDGKAGVRVNLYEPTRNSEESRPGSFWLTAAVSWMALPIRWTVSATAAVNSGTP